MMDAGLLRAYRETDYIVGRAGGALCGAAHAGFVLHIGMASTPLESLYRQYDVGCAAFVTAFNPYSRRASRQENQAGNARLQAWLERRGYRYFHGVGRHPDGQWPGEPGFLILGLSRRGARALGRFCRQNAVVWCGGDAVAQLDLLCRESRAGCG